MSSATTTTTTCRKGGEFFDGFSMAAEILIHAPLEILTLADLGLVEMRWLLVRDWLCDAQSDMQVDAVVEALNVLDVLEVTVLGVKSEMALMAEESQKGVPKSQPPVRYVQLAQIRLGKVVGTPHLMLIGACRHG